MSLGEEQQIPFQIETEVQTISAHFSAINQMVISPDHRMLFTAGMDGTIFAFNIGEQVYNLKDHSLRPAINLEVD